VTTAPANPRCIHEPARRRWRRDPAASTGTGRPDTTSRASDPATAGPPGTGRIGAAGGQWRPPASEAPSQPVGLFDLSTVASSTCSSVPAPAGGGGPWSGAEAEHAHQLSSPLLRALYVSLPVGVTGQACRGCSCLCNHHQDAQNIHRRAQLVSSWHGRLSLPRLYGPVMGVQCPCGPVTCLGAWLSAAFFF